MKTKSIRLNAAVERYRREQLFEIADAAYCRGLGKRDPDMAAWGSALGDGL